MLHGAKIFGWVSLLKLRIVFEGPADPPPAAEKACGFPVVREDLPAFFFRRRLEKSSWHWFLLLYLLDSTSGLSVLENQNEAETGGRQWKKEIGRSRRAQPELS
ncbi:hypothetical protein [Alkalicoccus halolimnae]|uniref:Uncharacterized protein n=1 Tax=Alkalicoccus halolimnae TaxID=1667239 RepID=A0AAJ8LV74_9BACI